MKSRIFKMVSLILMIVLIVNISVVMLENGIVVVSAQGFNYNATEDAYIHGGNPDTNYGGSNDLIIKDGSGGGTATDRISFIKVNFSSYSSSSCDSSFLYFYNNAVDGETPISVYGYADDNWTEDEITWNDQPSGSNAQYIGVVNVSATGWHSIDVTDYVNNQMSDKTVTFKLEDVTHAGTYLKFNSKDSGVNIPYLVINSPEPTPAPTPTPTPTPSLLFSDDFNDGNANGWTTSGGSWSVNNYEYLNTGNGLSTAGEASWTDYYVQAKVKLISANYGTVIGRYVDSNNFYQVEVHAPNDEFGLWKKVNNVWTRIGSYATTIDTGTEYTIGLEMNGTTLKGYLNGIERISVTDNAFSGGKIGLRSNDDARFDDVYVGIAEGASQTPTPTPAPTSAPTPTPVSTPTPTPAPGPGNTVNVSTVSALVDAVNNASPGDTIILEDGVYQNAEFTLSANGSSGAYITVRSETPGGASFTSDSQVVFDNASYIRFQDFYFNGNIRTGNGSDTYANANILIKGGSSYININNNRFYASGNSSHSFGPVVLVTGSHYNTIENNTFDSSHGVSVTVKDASTYNIIRRNHFKNIAASGDIFGDNNGMECILAGSQADRNIDLYTIAEYNLFEDVIGDGSEIISNKSSSNIYRYNTFRDCTSMMTLRFGDDCIAEGNFFFNVKGGIRAYGSGHLIINNYIESALSGAYYASIKIGHGDDSSYQAAHYAKVINNTIIDPSGVGLLIGRSGTLYQPENVIVKNNFISADNGTAIVETSGSDVTYTTNILSLTGSAAAGVSGSGISQASVTLVQDGELDRPSSGSPLKNAGTADSNVTVDMDGQSRSTIDVGADEESTETVVRGPLVSTDVGCDF